MHCQDLFDTPIQPPGFANVADIQCAAKKVSPKVVCHFPSNHLEFLREKKKMAKNFRGYFFAAHCSACHTASYRTQRKRPKRLNEYLRLKQLS